jgi:adenylate cyclase
MNKARSTYLVHAKLMVTGPASAKFDDANAGFPLARRMNRIERVVASYRGRIDQLFSNGLLISFDTADAAVLGAREMQHRCAGLPQISGYRLALRVGIQQCLVRQRLNDETDNSQENVSRLAFVDDGIVASEFVVSTLNPDLRVLTTPLDNPPFELVAYKVDWHREIPSSAYGGESFWPASQGTHPIGPYLLLHQGLKTIELTESNPVATVGRNPSNDLVSMSIHVSRQHCRIERQADCILLTDTSTNGTCVMTDEGVEFLVKKDSFYLKGKGLLFFGRLCNGERRGGVRFEAY